MSGNWLDLSNSSNRYIRMYVKGFVDVSGGNVRLRGKNDNLLVDQGDTSFNLGNVFVGNVLTCSGGVVVKNNLNMVGLINQSNITLSGGYIYKEIVSDAINTNIITLTNTVNTLSTNLVANTTAGSVTLGSGANVFLGNVTNNTTVNSLKLVTLGDASINGNLFINKDLNVTGNLSVNQYQTKQTITTLNYQLQVVEDLSINGRLFLNGNAAITGDVSFGSRLIMSTSNFTGTVSPNSTAATSSTWVNNGVTWTSSVSSTYANASYHGFDTLLTGAGRWVTDGYAASSGGVYNSTRATSTTIQNVTTAGVASGSSSANAGEWLQIQSSIPTVMQNFTLITWSLNTGYLTELPGTFFIVGSTDNSTWYPIVYCNYTTNPLSSSNTSGGLITIPSSSGTATQNSNVSVTSYSTSKNAYNYFRIVVKNKATSTGTTGQTLEGYITIGDWNINFTPPTTSAITLAPSTTTYGQLNLTGDLALSPSNFTGTVSPNSIAATSATWLNNGISWTASSSGVTGVFGIGYYAFDTRAMVGDLYGWLQSGTNTTANITGIGGAVSGNRLQLYTNGVNLIFSTFPIDSGGTARLPRTFYILGSNDGGSIWYPLAYIASTAGSVGANVGGTVNVRNGTVSSGMTYSITSYGYNNNSYTTFAYYVITNWGDGVHQLAEWSPVFIPTTQAITLAPSTTAYGQLNLTGGLTTTQNVGIGTNNPGNTLHIHNNAAFQIKVSNPQVSGGWNLGMPSNDTSFWFQTNGYSGYVWIGVGGQSWNASSDRRIKENIVPLPNSLENIMKLNPVSYTIINDVEQKKQTGLIAQEVIDVFPEVVNISKNPDYEGGLYGIAYTEFIPVLIKGMQEQQSQIDTLVARLAAAGIA